MIDENNIEPTPEAKKLFPNNKEIQIIYTKLSTSRGGIHEAVKLLNLDDEYQMYKNATERIIEYRKTAKAAFLINTFTKLCRNELVKKYANAN